jgi:hypothetical protein
MDHVTHLGLDVHKETIAVAVLRPGSDVPDERTIAHTPQAIRLLAARYRGRAVACYEAGPSGYDSIGCSCRSASRATSSPPPSSLGVLAAGSRLSASRRGTWPGCTGPASSPRSGSPPPRRRPPGSRAGPGGPEGRPPQDPAPSEELPAPPRPTVPQERQGMDRQGRDYRSWTLRVLLEPGKGRRSSARGPPS